MFELKDGGHTTILFYQDNKGTTHPFPLENLDIVRIHGTDKSNEMLELILKDGVTALSDRIYIAFMGPPIPPYEIRCYCGNVVKAGHDKKGYYIEGSPEIIFYPRDKDQRGGEAA